MNEFEFVYYSEELTLELTAALVHYGARKLPFRKYTRKDFERCLLHCAAHVVDYYQIKVNRRFRETLRDFITLLGELFSSKTISGIAELLPRIAPFKINLIPDVPANKGQAPPATAFSLAAL